MKAAVLALQGAFIEHEKKLSSLGISCLELREKSDLEQSFDLLVLPGGESTVQGKLLRELDMFDTLKARIEDSIKVLATCAGMILLANKIENDQRLHFATMPVTVKRNAYGRQLGSFYTEDQFKPLGKIPMTFIRAPYIKEAGKDVEILATTQGRITAARYKNQLALSFHPELNNDLRLYEWWLREKPLP